MLNDLTPELRAAFERVNETLAKVQEARQLAKSCAELLRLPGSHPDFLSRARLRISTGGMGPSVQGIRGGQRHFDEATRFRAPAVVR